MHSLIFGGAILTAALLTVGFLTPFLSLIACGFAVMNLVIAFHAGTYFYAFAILDALALMLLGPGAYSIDARLFGRKVTVLPPRTDRDRHSLSQ